MLLNKWCLPVGLFLISLARKLWTTPYTAKTHCLHQTSTLPPPRQLMDPLAGPRLKTFDFAPLAALAPSERFVLSVTLAAESDASSIDPGIRGSVTEMSWDILEGWVFFCFCFFFRLGFLSFNNCGQSKIWDFATSSAQDGFLQVLFFAWFMYRIQ